MHNYWVAISFSYLCRCPYNFCAEDKFYYGVRIVTGSQQASGAIARNVFFTVTGTKSQTDKISLGLFQRLAERDAFQEDTHDDMIIESDQHFGDVQVVGVGLEYDPIADAASNLLACHWYVAFISIIDFQNEQSETQFPCYHWLGYNDKEVTAVSKVGKLIAISTCIYILYIANNMNMY